mgnify:CR=1 FL=1
MKELRLQHCATYDRLGVQTSKPEMLVAQMLDSEHITLGIGADPLARREYALTVGEAVRLADWIHTNTQGVNRLG